MLCSVVYRAAQWTRNACSAGAMIFVASDGAMRKYGLSCNRSNVSCFCSPFLSIGHTSTLLPIPPIATPAPALTKVHVRASSGEERDGLRP
jgi:hypothetical protein